MNQSGLDIIEYAQEGYKPLIDCNGWRVAYLRYLEELHPQNIAYLERHMATDEVFVLLAGEVTLMMGDGDASVQGVYGVPMQPHKLYNVKKGAWHGVLMSKDATILLVENTDTGKDNTEYYNLTPEIRQAFITEAKKIKDWA